MAKAGIRDGEVVFPSVGELRKTVKFKGRFEVAMLLLALRTEEEATAWRTQRWLGEAPVDRKKILLLGVLPPPPAPPKKHSALWIPWILGLLTFRTMYEAISWGCILTNFVCSNLLKQE